MEKIIAVQGDEVYLIAIGNNLGRVLSLEQGIYFAPFNLESLIARGYWEDFKGNQSILNKLKEQVRDEKG